MDWEIRVETYCGYRADEYPRRFWIRDVCLEILEIEDRWYSPGFSYFKVFADNANHYILKRSTASNTWSAYEVKPAV